MIKKTEIGVKDLIKKIQEELLEFEESEGVFSIDEITLEVNFLINGDIDSGFNLGVVSLGSQISEERVQKISIKMTPLISKDELKKIISQKKQLSKKEEKSVKMLVKGDAANWPPDK